LQFIWLPIHFKLHGVTKKNQLLSYHIKMTPKKLLAYYGDFDTYDVIPFNNNLIMVGTTDGIYQFDYSGLN